MDIVDSQRESLLVDGLYNVTKDLLRYKRAKWEEYITKVANALEILAHGEENEWGLLPLITLFMGEGSTSAPLKHNFAVDNTTNVTDRIFCGSLSGKGYNIYVNSYLTVIIVGVFRFSQHRTAKEDHGESCSG